MEKDYVCTTSKISVDNYTKGKLVNVSYLRVDPETSEVVQFSAQKTICATDKKNKELLDKLVEIYDLIDEILNKTERK